MPQLFGQAFEEERHGPIYSLAVLAFGEHGLEGLKHRLSFIHQIDARLLDDGQQRLLNLLVLEKALVSSDGRYQVFVLLLVLAGKTVGRAVQAVAKDRLDKRDIHIGPSDWVPWQDDNKVCFIRMEGKLFGDVPMNLELRLSVEDSPNSAGVAIDSIRCCKLALERGIGGVLDAPSAYLCKHPPQQFTDDLAYQMTNEFINSEAVSKKSSILDIPAPSRKSDQVVSGT